ncbi:hypothetical protein Tco_0347406 [Tanacetum coccineum]
MGVVADLGEHLAPMKRPDKIPNGDWGGFGAGTIHITYTDDGHTTMSQNAEAHKDAAWRTHLQATTRMTVLSPYR